LGCSPRKGALVDASAVFVIVETWATGSRVGRARKRARILSLIAVALVGIGVTTSPHSNIPVLLTTVPRSGFGNFPAIGSSADSWLATSPPLRATQERRRGVSGVLLVFFFGLPMHQGRLHRSTTPRSGVLARRLRTPSRARQGAPQLFGDVGWCRGQRTRA